MCTHGEVSGEQYFLSHNLLKLYTLILLGVQISKHTNNEWIYRFPFPTPIEFNMRNHWDSRIRAKSSWRLNEKRKHTYIPKKIISEYLTKLLLRFATEVLVLMRDAIWCCANNFNFLTNWVLYLGTNWDLRNWYIKEIKIKSTMLNQNLSKSFTLIFPILSKKKIFRVDLRSITKLHITWEA